MAIELFNLDAPPDFRGLDPDLPIKKYVRHLPHWRQDGATYAVTFRLADSIPKNKLRYLASVKNEWESARSSKRTDGEWDNYVKRLFALVEQWMDQGYGKCFLKTKRFTDELQRSLLHFQNEQYFLSCFTIMPNHCHLVIKPLPGFQLETILGTIKSVVGRFINRKLEISGQVWQQECFDRIIRDEEHLYHVIQYIGNNANAAGLPLQQWNRWVIPEWVNLGWGFREL